MSDYVQPPAAALQDSVTMRIARINEAGFTATLTDAQYKALCQWAAKPIAGAEYLQDGTLAVVEQQQLYRAIQLELTLDSIEVFVLPGDATRVMCVGIVKAKDRTHYFYLNAGKTAPPANVAVKHAKRSDRKAWWSDNGVLTALCAVTGVLFLPPLVLAVVYGDPGLLLLWIGSGLLTIALWSFAEEVGLY